MIHSGWIKFIDICAIILLGLVAGFIVPRLRAVSGIIATFLLLVAFVVANVFIFVYFNVWLNLIYPVLTMLAVYLGITVFRYISEERKRKNKGRFSILSYRFCH